MASNACTEDAVRFEVNDAPNSNYFYSDCNSASQVVVTSPLPDSNLTLIAPRLLVLHPTYHTYITKAFG